MSNSTQFLNFHVSSQQEPQNEQESVQHDQWADIIDDWEGDYVFCGLSWWQFNDRYSHQLAVAAFEDQRDPSKKLYVRFERDKDTWTPWSGGDLKTRVTTSSMEVVLTAKSFCVAKFTVDPTFAQRDQHTLESIGVIIDKINRFSSTYSFLAYNCWWFASCSFFCIGHCIGPNNLTIYCRSREANHHRLRPSTFKEAMSFCDIYYLQSHWPYWILVGHPIIVLTAGLSLITNWCYLTYSIAPALILAWLMYYIVSIAGAWGLVRRVVGCDTIDAENPLGVRLAFKVVVVLVLLMLYGGLFLVLAMSPGLSITREA
ncbi:hypothetical protein FRB95_003950 [Tulasnella sp. JGI-2019a]|nr:hypothetical protein FRB93_001911 [Tulasnella sp. JGI-2019a]KAG9030444.1 hypothetical protein FRB95_003950 [Tulasnella sp. JGI-2019a]